MSKFTLEADERAITENLQPHMYWAHIEVVTAIICANLPAMPTFLRHFWGNAKSVISPSNLESNRRPSASFHSTNHRDSHAFAYTAKRSIFGGSFHPFRNITTASTRSDSQNDQDSATSHRYQEKRDGKHTATKVSELELVPQLGSVAHTTEVLSSGPARNDGTGISNKADDESSIFPELPGPHHQHRHKTSFTGQEPEGNQFILRTDEVDVERSMA